VKLLESKELDVVDGIARMKEVKALRTSKKS